MAYEMVMPYHLHMPSYFLETFTEYPEKDGLQIYKEGKLIADVSVPTNFRVMGYMAPYYYSYIIPNMDEEDNSLMLYRFRL